VKVCPSRLLLDPSQSSLRRGSYPSPTATCSLPQFEDDIAPAHQASGRLLPALARTSQSQVSRQLPHLVGRHRDPHRADALRPTAGSPATSTNLAQQLRDSDPHALTNQLSAGSGTALGLARRRHHNHGSPSQEGFALPNTVVRVCRNPETTHQELRQWNRGLRPEMPLSLG
jgi:hypothetical protein